MSEIKNLELDSRISQSVAVLFPTSSSEDRCDETARLMGILESMGVEDSELGIRILDADTTVFEDFKKYININSCYLRVPEVKLKIVWEILKGNDPLGTSDRDLEDLARDLGKSLDELLKSGNVKKEQLKKMGKEAAKTFLQKVSEVGHKLADKSASLSEDLAESLQPVGNWTDLKLLQKYGKECPPAVEEELKKRTNGRPAIIFHKTGEVDVENSYFMVRKARRQDTPHTFEIKGEIKVLYKVGDFPANVFFECPIHSDTLLVDGYCEACGRKWDTTEYEKNVFLRLMIENMREKIDMRIYSKNSFDELVREFPGIYHIYERLKEEGKLPSMKRRMSQNVDDPFYVVHTRT